MPADAVNGESYDLVVIGGGVNGTGIAADATGRGLKVLLCEMNDLASATSSNSSKLIHGGLRYLEYYQFRLVREALAEREVLLKNAPHIISPLRFQLPHRPHLRPAWMIRAGLFLYDNLAKRTTLAKSKAIKFSEDSPLKATMRQGFEYSDGFVDDARLVVCNALAAAKGGATIKVRTKCTSAKRVDNGWRIELQDQQGNKTTVLATAIANAAGPWVASLFDQAFTIKSPKSIRLVKGSHIIVPRLHSQPQAYILQNEDSRIVFVIPYEDNFSLIGTTDVDYHGDPSLVAIDKEEQDYLIQVSNQHFKTQIRTADIVRTYSGVRPLLNDEADSAQAVSRDYSFEVQTNAGEYPLLSVFGGKITTYRKLSEAAVDKLCQFFPKAGAAWTKDSVLPGGDFSDKQHLQASLEQQYPWLASSLITRYVRSYGTLCQQFLTGKTAVADLGPDFGAGLYQLEVDYLINQEWAMCLEDVIWRRTKMGMYLSTEQKQQLDQYLQKATASAQKLLEKDHRDQLLAS
ncbi:MAG: glycerol-3-phosphate dehydrogenase [Osedax symbiont Rs1]|nr:MAG: glycerol-3-phosphate dehydrogenase [Osedax symbiont Rs1]